MISKRMILILLVAVYLLIKFAIEKDAFIYYDPNSTFAAQLMRKAMRGNGGPMSNPAYDKERVNRPFVASPDSAVDHVTVPELIRKQLCEGGECFYRYSKDNINNPFDPPFKAPPITFIPFNSIGGPDDTRYNTQAATRVFSPTTKLPSQRFYPQPDYVYYRDNLPQLYSTIILGPIVIGLCYVLFSKINRE